MDVFLTTFLMGMLMTVAGTGAVRKDIHERKLDVLDASILQRGFWRYTPVCVANTFIRSVAMGLYWSLLVGVPTLFILWAAIGDGEWAGWPYIQFKGMWASFFLAPCMFTMVYVAAIDISNFPGLEAAEYSAAGGGLADSMSGEEVEQSVLMSPGGSINLVPGVRR